MKKVVTMGGGTGSFTILSGLKELQGVELSAIVAMTDDGGSTGVLRDELGVLPPGDVRQCLVALSSEDKEMRALMNYRFDSGALKGHSFGNLLLAALEKIHGGFVSGIGVASKLLNICGTVIPVTHEQASMCVRLNNGETICGEEHINRSDIETMGVEKVLVDARANKDALGAIESADLIIIGPGNHFCSVLPCLAVEGIQDALQRSKASILYIVNLTNKKGHTMCYTSSTYVKDIEQASGKVVDYVLVNSGEYSEVQLAKYSSQEGETVLVEDDLGNEVRVIREDVVSHIEPIIDPNDSFADLRALIRHDSTKVAQVVQRIVEKV